jgi:hypothetical protein
MPGGCALSHALTLQSSAIAPRHFRGRAAFVLKHQPLGSDLAYRRPPRLTPGLDGRGILLLGVERLFFSRSPILCSTRQRC